MPTLTQSTAVLAVADVPQTVAFYVTVLGFTQHWLWGNPPTFGCVGMGAIELFLCQQPDLARTIEGHQHFFSVDDVDALHGQHVAAGATVISPPENKPWSVREYTVRDCNGYHLRFSGPLAYERPPTALDSLPSYIRVEPGLPDYDTYGSLFASVGWATDEASMRSALANTLASVLATDTRDGQVVGMTRATGDGRHLMIWDVIVRPSHQGQKIGAAMVERLLEDLRQRGYAAGAFVGLFTGRPGFYETLGFKKGIGMHRGL
jgi:catechol 2,3-dioxygenase-like lactoylglutathione lyase family enzyme